ncbi:MAG TPA: hypothetical protein VFG14_19835, partial [Chthoniobacteraceae bacterium]|nr:hypothetical protein [Chthoniobacteraceae bacterium]
SRLREALNLVQQQQRAVAPAIRALTGPAGSGQLVAPSGGADTAAHHPSPRVSAGFNSLGSDPTAAGYEWEHVLFIADPLQRSQRLAQLLAALTAENAPEIAGAFERVKKAGIKFADEQRLFLRAWGKLDGDAAVQYAVGHGGEASNEALAALGGWAAADPQQAKEWLEALPDSEAKEKLVYGLLDGWSTIDFQAAAAYAESRPSSPAGDQFRELLLQRALRSGGITAAQSWIDRIPETDQSRDYKQRAFGDVVEAMLYRDPAAAARWISELDGQSFVSAEAVANTAAKLAETSPTDALSWLMTLKSTDVENIGRGAGTLLQTWAQQSPEAAGEWLRQNTNHPYYDQMTASYVGNVASVDREAAKAWAQTIRNSEVRTAALAATEPRTLLSYNFALSGKPYGERVTNAVEFLSTSTGVLRVQANGANVDTVITNGVTFDQTTEDVVVGNGGKNPHGSGAQWANCASCHNSSRAQ